MFYQPPDAATLTGAALSVSSLDTLLELHGISPMPKFDVLPERPISEGDLGGTVNNREYSLSASGRGKIFKLADYAEEIGAVGTPIYSGHLATEPNPEYGPYQVRGYGGHHGIYEEFYRTEPILFEGINEGNNLFTAGKVDFVEPDVPESQKSAAEAFTEFCNRWWHRQWRGPHYFQKNLGWAKVFGFMAHEIVWAVDEKGRPYPRKIAMREPSTVDQWIMNPRGDELAAVTFQMSGDARSIDGMSRYTLTATGDRLIDRKVLLCNINARGNNFEGVSLVRPAIFWIKLKQLLGQIAAVSAQRYGVPITVIQNALKELLAGAEGGDASEIKMLHRLYSNLQAINAPVISVPDGLNVETHSPPGTMPELQNLIAYCDQMIAKSVASEAGTLAGRAMGSYAMAATLDDRFLRAQPGFANEVLMPINWLVADIANAMKVDIDEYPVAQWSMDGFADNSKWIEDATRAMGGMPMSDWPDEMKKEACDKLGLPPTTFDDFVTPQKSVTAPGASFGRPNLFADQLRELRGEKCGAYELADADSLTWSSGLDAKAALGLMELSERKLASRFNSLAVQHQKRWRELVRDQGGDLRQDMEQIEREFLPQYESIAREEMRSIQDASGKMLLRDLGIAVTRKDPLPESQSMAMALDAVALSTAMEAFNRQQGLMLDATAEHEIGGTGTGIPKLKLATFGLIARGVVGTAFNAGRDEVAHIAIEAIESQGSDVEEPSEGKGSPKAVAFRSSMLDDGVCPACADLDWETPEDKRTPGSKPAIHAVGSAGYYRDMPPSHCHAGPKRCRCVYIMSFPESAREYLEALGRSE